MFRVPQRRSRRNPLLAAAVVVALTGLVHFSQGGDRPTPAAHSDPASPAHAGALRGYASVTDGDTLRIGRTRIRLHGVNAAELDTAEGQEARRQLIRIIGREAVRCEDTGQRSYDRIVARCYIEAGDLGALMIGQGWATDWPKYSGGRYSLNEMNARLRGLGFHSAHWRSQ